jgi:hypothetical protein
MLLLALSTLAYADSAGFYHPNDIATASALFGRAADSAGVTFEERSAKAEGIAGALRDYELALDLLAVRAPVDEHVRLEELDRQFNREFAVLQVFSDAMMDDFMREFEASLERALADLPGAIPCEREIADGPQIPGMRTRTKANPECRGEDLNARLAATMDADPTLGAAIAEILALEWPDLSVNPSAQTPSGGGERHVHVDALLRAGARSALRDIDADDEQARLPFEAAIEEGASKEELERLVADAQRVTEQTATRRGALAAPVLAAASKVTAKWTKKGEPATGWCANPVLFGGCTGADDTGELVPRLLEQAKVANALP